MLMFGIFPGFMLFWN